MGRHERFAACSLKDFSDIKELYRSGAGAVYKARFNYDEKTYVLKERVLSELGKRKNITNEVQLLSQLNHPNVIRCEGWFWDHKKGALVIVLEYCENGDLFKLISKRKARSKYFDEPYIWHIFHQICLAVTHLHESGIIHRDLKALNVMLTRGNTVPKLADLGVSRQVSEDTMMLKTFYGTPLYLSPELVDNSNYNEKTDIWSLGVLLYEFAALRCPFRSKTLLGLAKTIKRGIYEPLPDHFSSAMGRCVQWLLNTDYMKRPNIKQILRWVEGQMAKAPLQRLPLAGAAADDDTDDESVGTVDDEEQAAINTPTLPSHTFEPLMPKVDLASGRKSERDLHVITTSAPPSPEHASPIRPQKHNSTPALALSSRMDLPDVKVTLTTDKKSARMEKAVTTPVEPKLRSRGEQLKEERVRRFMTEAGAEEKLFLSPGVEIRASAARTEESSETSRSNLAHVKARGDKNELKRIIVREDKAMESQIKEKSGSEEKKNKKDEVKPLLAPLAGTATTTTIKVSIARLRLALRKQVGLSRRLLQTRSLLASVNTASKKSKKASQEAVADEKRLADINARITECNLDRLALEEALETGMCNAALAAALGLLGTEKSSTSSLGPAAASAAPVRRPQTASAVDDSNYPNHQRLMRKDCGIGARMQELQVDAAWKLPGREDKGSFRRGPAEHSLFKQGDTRAPSRGWGGQEHGQQQHQQQERPRTARFNIIRQSYS